MQAHIWREVGWEEERGGLDGDRLPLAYLYSGRTVKNGKSISVTWAILGPCLVIPVHKTLSVRARRVEFSKIWITNLCECI